MGIRDGKGGTGDGEMGTVMVVEDGELGTGMGKCCRGEGYGMVEMYKESTGINVCAGMLHGDGVRGWRIRCEMEMGGRRTWGMR